MKRKKLYGALFAVCAALTAAFIVCAVLFNRGGAEFTSVVAGEKQYARVAVFEGGSLLAGRDNTLAAYDEAGALLWEDASLGNVAVAIELSGDGSAFTKYRRANAWRKFPDTRARAVRSPSPTSRISPFRKTKARLPFRTVPARAAII